MKKILLKNANVVSSKGVKLTDILIVNEKIKQIKKNIKPDKETIVKDLNKKYVFPGFIDGHTHFDLSVAGTTTIDDFQSGTKAAISGGTTTIIDYGTQYKGETLDEGLNNWLKKAESGVSCDFGVHMSISDWNDEAKKQIKLMIKKGVTSFKLYTTYDIKLDDKDLYEAMEEIAKCKGITGVHCENDGLIQALRGEVIGDNNKKVIMHALTRPDSAEAESVNKLTYFSKETGCAFLAVHVTNKKALDEIKLAKKKGYKVFAETCPQYLFFDDSVYKKNFFESSKYVCAPPIRKKSDVSYLWQGINDGSIDIISTDHCSFTTKQKSLGKNDFRKIPGGLNGVEQRGILMYDAVTRKKLTINKMCELLSENPAYLFGLYDRKGFIKEGYDADLVIIDPNKTTKLSIKNQVSKSDYCVFEGKVLRGAIDSVYLRGTEVVKNGKITAINKGKFIKRKTFKEI